MITAVETLSLQAAASRSSARSYPPVSADLMALLEHFDCGVAIVDADRDIVGLNDAVRCLLGDGLAVTRHRLRTSLPSTQGTLDAMLDAARRDGEVRNMALPRPSGERPLILRAQPLSRDKGEEGASLVLVFVFLAEPRLTEASNESLRALGLTRAEAEVAVLLGAGFSPREVADRLDVKIATVRAHLKRIFQKLGLCRQTELVQMVTRLNFVK
jgi:DNA-binding CsgD family transcriptional regulator